MIVAGIDLSGPRNTADTCVTIFEQRGSELHFRSSRAGADDQSILESVSSLEKSGRIILGLDAPLSYNPHGGDRVSDSQLRQRVKGSRVGVMTPTMTRMVYLTLRGVALTRALESLKPELDLHLVEVHPGASLLLRGAAPADVNSFKRDQQARSRLLEWLEKMQLVGMPRSEPVSDHFVAACAAALAAWKWSLGQPAWIAPAQPPQHPYDFAC